MKTMIVCFALLAGGALMVPYSAVGTVVPGTETAALFGGACIAIDNGAVNTQICSSVCGSKWVKPTKSDPSGGSAASQKCGTSESCTGMYGVTGTCSQ
jgi:hypothetical protein